MYVIIILIITTASFVFLLLCAAEGQKFTGTSLVSAAVVDRQRQLLYSLVCAVGVVVVRRGQKHTWFVLLLCAEGPKHIWDSLVCVVIRRRGTKPGFCRCHCCVQRDRKYPSRAVVCAAAVVVFRGTYTTLD